MSIDCNVWAIETNQHMVTILEAPSQTNSDMIKKILAHGFPVKAAVVVVDITPGALTADFGFGQLAEHTQIAIALGATQLVVALNNMDALDLGFDQEQYQHLKNKAEALLSSPMTKSLSKVNFTYKSLALGSLMELQPSSKLRGSTLLNAQRPSSTAYIMQLGMCIHWDVNEIARSNRFCA